MKKTFGQIAIIFIVPLLFLNTSCSPDVPKTPLVEPTPDQQEPEPQEKIHLDPGDSASLEGVWSDFLYLSRIQREGSGSLLIAFHANGEEGAYFLVMGDNGFLLQKEIHGQLEHLTAYEADLEPLEYHPLEVQYQDGVIRVFYLGDLVIEFEDNEPLPAGGISFEAIDDLRVTIDHITVEDINGQAVDVDSSIKEEPGAALPSPTSAHEKSPAEDQPIHQLEPSQWEWVRLGGPPGGTGYDIRYNFDNPDIWYVTDANSGVHISTDNGKTWHESNTGIVGQSGPSNDAKGVFCLTVDPHDPQIIWIGTIGHGHIYRSADGGKSWELRENGIEIEYDQLSFRGFTIDPRSSEIVYAMGETNDESLGGPRPWKGGVGGVIYKTTDAGQNWTKIWDGGMPSSLTRYMWINPEDPDELYVSTGIFDRSAVGEAESEEDPMGGLGILKSTDGGKTWSIQGKENGLRNLYVGSMYMHPDNPDVLLAAVGHLGGPEAVPYWESFLDSGNPLPLGVYRTEDGGESWTQTLVPDEVEEYTSVELCPSDPRIGYAASRFSMYRTTDAGLTWQLTARPWSPPGISAGFPIDMQCDPRNVDRVFVNNYGGGNYISEDGGATWTSASSGYTGAQVFGIDFDPDHPQRIYAMTFSGIWRSDDAGRTWTGIRYAPDDIQGYRLITVDPADSSHIFSGQNEFIESFDGGLSWTKIWDARETAGFEEVSQQGIPVMTFAPSDNTRLYAGYSHELCALYQELGCTNDPLVNGPGLMVSKDGGKTWNNAGDGNVQGRDIRSLAVDPENADIVYAASDQGIFKTANGGKSWQKLPLPTMTESTYAVAVDPWNSDHLLASIDREGLYASSDGGRNWLNVSAGMESNGSISDIVFDPQRPEVVFASDFLSGVYYSGDGGVTWTKINQGLYSRAISDLAISADGNHLYAGSNEDGMYRLDLTGSPPAP